MTTATATKAAKAATTPKPKVEKGPKVPSNLCQCNAQPTGDGMFESCGRLTNGRFAPGHDAKLKGVLIQAARNGEPYTVITSGKAVKHDPSKVAASFGWSQYTDAAIAGAAEHKAKQEAAAARKAMSKEQKAGEAKEAKADKVAKLNAKMAEARENAAAKQAARLAEKASKAADKAVKPVVLSQAAAKRAAAAAARQPAVDPTSLV